MMIEHILKHTKSLSIIMFSFITMFVGAFILSQPVHALDPLDPACQGPGSSSPVCNSGTGNPLVGPDGVITRVTGLLSVIVGIAAVIVIMLAGLKYITSGGNSGELQRARDSIIYAGIALGVAAFAQAFVIFILSGL